MNVPDGFSMFLQGKTDYLREVQEMLKDEGIPVRTGPLPGSGWEQRAWLAVASNELQRARTMFDEYQDQLIPDDTGKRRSKLVADFDADETTCPACETKFNPKGLTECPDCGLRFG